MRQTFDTAAGPGPDGYDTAALVTDDPGLRARRRETVARRPGPLVGQGEGDQGAAPAERGPAARVVPALAGALLSAVGVVAGDVPGVVWTHSTPRTHPAG